MFQLAKSKHKGATMTKEQLLAEAARTGYSEWTTVAYEPMAKQIKARLLKEWPQCDANIGIIDDGYIIWYRNPFR